MDRLEAMSLNVAVTDTGSFSAASRRLGTPVATVSRKVADLEGRLKAELFQRSSRRMTLTDAGRDYVDACKRIIEQVEDAERQVSGEYRSPTGDPAGDDLGDRRSYDTEIQEVPISFVIGPHCSRPPCQ
jgi:DNA-binding transcriptional LysR family regulator